MRLAVDANVLIDEENQDPDVLDALSVIRGRVARAQFFVTETVIQELAWLSANGATEQRRTLAEGALMQLLSRGYTPLAMSAVERGIAGEIGLKLRMKHIIPHEEENDATLLAEAALKGCEILLTSDQHLLEANEDVSKLWGILKDADAQAHQIVIARPRDIVRRFSLSR